MKRLRAIFCIFGLLIVSTPAVLADDPHAQEVLKQARAALGGDERLQKVEALNITGQYRRMFGDRQLGGDREVSILLPNKYLVEDAMNPGGLSTAMINTRVLSGERAWSSSSGGGGGMVFRMGGPGGQQLTPEQMEAAFRRSYQAEFTRYLLALLLSAPSSIPVEYRYVGESDVEDIPAEVIDVIGPDKLSIRLFFDKQSHMPMLLSYRGPKPRDSARGKGRWEIGSRLSWGKDFGPEQQQTGGPQVRMVRIGGGEGAAPPSISTGATKKYRMEFYLQAFNLLNHTNLGVFNGVETSPYFAQATSAQGPRQLEAGLRIDF